MVLIIGSFLRSLRIQDPKDNIGRADNPFLSAWQLDIISRVSIQVKGVAMDDSAYNVRNIRDAIKKGPPGVLHLISIKAFPIRSPPSRLYMLVQQAGVYGPARITNRNSSRKGSPAVLVLLTYAYKGIIRPGVVIMRVVLRELVAGVINIGFKILGRIIKAPNTYEAGTLI